MLVLSSTYKLLVFILPIFRQRLAIRRLFPFYTACPIIISSLTRPLIALRESCIVNASPVDVKITNRHNLYTVHGLLAGAAREDRNRQDDVNLLDQNRICFWRILSGSMSIVSSSTP
jgi:hypothetical protein